MLGHQESTKRRDHMIFFGMAGVGEYPTNSDDMDLIDPRHILDGLYRDFRPTSGDLWHEKITKPDQGIFMKGTQTKAQKVVLGNRINSEGDENIYIRPRFEAVEIPTSHSIFNVAHLPPVSERISVPLLTINPPHDSSYGNIPSPFAKILWDNEQ